MAKILDTYNVNIDIFTDEMAKVLNGEGDPINFIMDNVPNLLNEIQAKRLEISMLKTKILEMEE